jgi:hypothetical protein
LTTDLIAKPPVAHFLEPYEARHVAGFTLLRDGVRYVAVAIGVEADMYGGLEGHYVTEFVREDLYQPFGLTRVNGWAGGNTGAFTLFPDQGARMVVRAAELVNLFAGGDEYAAEKLVKSFSDAIRYFAAYRCEQEGVRPAKIAEASWTLGPDRLRALLDRISREIDSEISRQVSFFSTFLSAAGRSAYPTTSERHREGIRLLNSVGPHI